MNTLLENIGCLIELKRPNRDMLAASIGTTRQNLISAIKGRRPLPARYMPALRHALGLDDMNLLTNKQVHFMTVVDGEKLSFIAAAGSEAVKLGAHAGNILRDILTVCGGKGGGRPDCAMGGGRDIDKIDDATPATKGAA